VSNPDDFAADDELAGEDSEELELEELPLDEDEDLALEESGEGDGEIALVEDLAPIDDFPVEEEDADELPAPAVVEEEEEDEEGPDLDEEAEDVVVAPDADDEESLDVLLSREKTPSDDDLGRLEEPRDGFSVPAQPISPNEFTCRSCFLVKNRAQLADEDKLFCLDCA